MAVGSLILKSVDSRFRGDDKSSIIEHWAVADEILRSERLAEPMAHSNHTDRPTILIPVSVPHQSGN